MMNEREIDYDYIASNISSLTRIMVRIFKNKTLVSLYDPCGFPTDPAMLYLDKLVQIDKEVSYYITPYDQFYGVIRHKEYQLIIGPTFQMTPPRAQIREFMFQLGIRQNYFEQYLNFMLTITPMPLELFLHELCLIYYFISEKKLSLADFTLYDSYSEISRQNRKTAEDVSLPDKENLFDSVPVHGTLEFEQTMLSLITDGDLDKLKKYFSGHSAGRPGKTSGNYLRQVKNIFISSVTLVSRAAIAGGLPSEESLTLSDRYIQHGEALNNPEQVMNLQYNMVMDYATLVSELRKGARYDKFMRSVTGYIREHLTESFNVERMANELFVSRSYLSTKFKKETGMTLTAYIQEQKIKKAMEYLKNTDKSILEISTFLGFSSQGYFQNVFKKCTGMTPKEYREQ